MANLSLSIMVFLATSTISTPFKQHGHHRWWRSRSNRPRIFGGEEIEMNEFPFLVGIRVGPSEILSCGGSLISWDLVLTAAHCMQGAPDTYTIIAGDHRLSSVDATEQSRKVRTIVPHDMYVAGKFPYDIALVQVETPFQFNSAVHAVRLPFPGTMPTSTAIAIGWGMTSNVAQPSDVPRKLTQAFTYRDTCELSYPDLSEGEICYGNLNLEGACRGDSGGPLLCGKYLCGVSGSGGSACGQGIPDVYADVAYYGEWIRDQMDMFFNP